MIPVSEQKWN